MILNNIGGATSRAGAFEFEISQAVITISSQNQPYVITGVDIPTDTIKGFLLILTDAGTYDDTTYKKIDAVYWNESNDDSEDLPSSQEGKTNILYTLSGAVNEDNTNEGSRAYSRENKTISINLYGSQYQLQLVPGTYNLAVWW